MMKSLEEVMARVDALKKDLEELGVHVGVKSLGSLLEDGKKREIVSISLLLPVLEEDLERSDLTPIEEARAFQIYLGWNEQLSFEDGRQEGLRTLVDKLSGHLPVMSCFDEEAVKEHVLERLVAEGAVWFMHYDHGSEYVMWGDDEEPIIDLSNLGELAGKHVYCMNCSSGKGLSTHAVAKGVLEYWGYVDVVAFTTDAVDEFGEAFNYGIVRAVSEGRWLKDVLEETRQHGYDIADKLRLEGKILAAAALVNDMNILHVFYEGGPPPPGPECGLSRILQRLFGWNGLWFFRMLRQRIFPEKRLV